MLNRVFPLVLLVTLLFSSCQKAKTPSQSLRAGELEVLWTPSTDQIKSTDLLSFEFTAIHPLGSFVEVQLLDSDNFELFELEEIASPPASPSKLRSHFKLLLEPPAPGKYTTPQVSLILKNNSGIISQLKSPEQEIEILSINPPEEFQTDHQGSLKERPSKWLLLCLIVLALPFLPKKKKQADKIILKIKADDLDKCEATFMAIEEILEKIMRYNFLVKADDFNSMLAQLSQQDEAQSKLKDFVVDYQTQRFSPQSTEPSKILADLKKLFEEICP
ncbi:hypothetical protein PQO01_10640 [Lentisphaera marina]|uniref:hypothetical protein n=1 Tax=Lentisphaera marina TaxID=1111041 RepID=UPI002366078C|nr:hypothetical protein [Lentisphaera marina]MDD7985408.1 hypothetical protein [Lentisphaera marina]